MDEAKGICVAQPAVLPQLSGREMDVLKCVNLDQIFSAGRSTKALAARNTNLQKMPVGLEPDADLDFAGVTL